jgi:hypothetical protein
MINEFMDDCVWMSYRYCIGRHTIAAHCHAADIANNVYDPAEKNRLAFYAKDINQEIYNILHINNFLDCDYVYNIPKEKFKPLEILYRGFKECGIDNSDKLKKLKTLEVYYEHSTGEFKYRAIMHQYADNYKSLWDIQDLEIWQQLANYFSIDEYKTCILNDDTECQYYEFLSLNSYGSTFTFNEYKIPINRKFSTNITYIPEENIKS